MNRNMLFSTATESLSGPALPARPVIDLASGQIVSMDLRYKPGLHLFSLADFSFHELPRRADNTLPGHISLSLMPGSQHLADPAFPGKVAKALKLQGLAPERMTLYFQDRHCLEQGMAALDTLITFKRLGFQLGLDIKDLDGMPSLFVERLPVDILRLDPLDILDVAVNLETASLATDLVRFAGNLLMHAAARGVRHENQLAMLKRLGFAFAQGPYFAAPTLPSKQAQEQEDASGKDLLS